MSFPRLWAFTAAAATFASFAPSPAYACGDDLAVSQVGVDRDRGEPLVNLREAARIEAQARSIQARAADRESAAVRDTSEARDLRDQADGSDAATRADLLRLSTTLFARARTERVEAATLRTRADGLFAEARRLRGSGSGGGWRRGAAVTVL